VRQRQRPPEKSSPLPGMQASPAYVRMLRDCQQVEHEFSEDEWDAFIECARNTFDRGDFIHNEFEAKRQEKHRETSDRDILNAMSSRAYLVAYPDEWGRERVYLWDPQGKNTLIVCTLDDGILDAYPATGFLRSLSSKTGVRRLRWPK